MFSFYARFSARAPCLTSGPSFRYLTTAASKAKTVPKKPSQLASSPKPSTQSSPQTFAEQGRSQRLNILATKILNAGRNEIYRNSASNGFVATSLSIMVMSYGCIGYLYSTRLWEDNVAKERGLHWAVPKAYQITMISWGLLAAYSFTRTLGLVKSIKLVKTADKVLLEASIRRPLPFMRPEKYLSEPHTLVVNRGKLYGSAYSEGMITAPEGESIVSRVTRAVFYTPFHNTRKALGGVGLVPIQIGPSGAQRHLMLDSDGKFSNGGQDLLDLSQDEL